MRTEEPMEEVQRAIGSGTPTEAIACYARWWQLESYVREIVYTEMRSAYGTNWAREVGERASSRAAGDQINHYMASADAEEALLQLTRFHQQLREEGVPLDGEGGHPPALQDPADRLRLPEQLHRLEQRR